MQTSEIHRIENEIFPARLEIGNNNYYTHCKFVSTRHGEYFEIVARPLGQFRVGSIVDPWRGLRTVRRFPWADWWSQWGQAGSEYECACKALNSEWEKLRDQVAAREEVWVPVGAGGKAC